MRNKLKYLLIFLSVLVLYSFLPSNTCYAEVSIDSLQGYLNYDIAQKAINQSNNPKYADINSREETVDPITGNLLLKETDFTLTGKDGLDLSIGRIYNSSQDECNQKSIVVKTPTGSYTETVDTYWVGLVLNNDSVSYFGPYSSSALAQAYAVYLISINSNVKSHFIEYRPVVIKHDMYNVSITNTIDKYNYSKTKYYLGAGWSFALPSIQFDNYNGDLYMYYHDGSGASYRIYNTVDKGTCNLTGYQGNDVRLVDDNGSYISPDNIPARYKLISPDNRLTYFAADGRLLGIKDRFGNEIKVSYVNKQIYDSTYPLISKITDSVGREITFNYSGDNIVLTIKAPNETNQISYTYKRSFLSKTLDGTTYQYPVLDYVEDPLGRRTYYENYYSYNNNSWPTERFDFGSKEFTNALTIQRYLLGAVVYNGSKTVYEYEKVTRNLGESGITEAYRIKSRHDEIQRYNSSTQAWVWVTNNNRIDYSYSGDCTGYPICANEEAMSELYQFWSQATASNGLKVKNIFNGYKKLIQTDTIASNNEKEVVKYLEFDTTYPYKPTKTEITKYCSDGAVASTYYTGTTYNSWGGIATTTVPITSQQYNEAAVKARYTTTYFYENTTYKYFITKKQWWQNDATLLMEMYTYDTLGRISTYRNTKAEITSYSYSTDSSGNKIQEISTPIENSKYSKTRYVYGSETGYAYPKEVIEYYTQGTSTQSKTSYTYNMLFGLVKTQTDNENKTTTYTYDNIGRVKVIQTPGYVNAYNANYSVRQEYDYIEGYNWEYIEGSYSGIYGTTVNSRTVYVNNSANTTAYYNQTSELYDAYGNLRQQRLYDGSAYVTKAKYTYDNLQRVITAVDAEGNAVSQTYNAWGQVNEATDAIGNLYVSNYDIRNNMSSSFFVAQSNIASYRSNTALNTYKEDYSEIYYDQFGQAIERRVYANWPTMTGALSELYQYDMYGNLTGYTDPNRNLNENGVTTSYLYDALNRLIQVKDAKNQVTNIAYTVLGDIASISMKEKADSSTSVSLYAKSYNELGSITAKTDATSLSTTYSYNTIGLATQSVDRNGNTATYSYDGLNQLKQITLSNTSSTQSLSHKYNYTNPFGYTSEELYVNGIYTTVNTYSYNAAGQITQKNVSGSGYVNSYLKYQYDNAGRLKSVAAGVADSNYFYTSYKYTGDRLTKVQTNGLSANSDAVTDNAVYEYYPDGKLKKITYPKLNDGTYLTTEYVYNALGRMTSIINKKGSTVLSQYQYTYDANGNIITVNNGQTVTTYGYDKLNRLVEIQPQLGSSTLYTYDLRGNRLTLNSTSLNYVDASYSYDLENKLQTVTKGGLTTTMKYSADGLRTKKESAYGYTNYIYNQSGNLVAEAQNSSSVTSNYVWGPDRVLSKKTNSGSEYYYLYNGHGDVVQMVDRNGNIVNNYSYDEWGNITTSSETVSNPFKYAGEVYDSETGLYYLRARYYDPTVGRFLNEDTVEGQVNNPLSLNVYSYCYNNPLIYKDPSGHIAGVDDVTILLVLATGAVIYVTYEYLSSPEGQKAIKDGATAIQNGVIIAGKAVTEAAKAAVDGIVNGVSWIGDKVSDAWSGFTSLFKKKPVNLPSMKKLTIDMDHIVSGHTPNGNRRDPNGNKGVFYGMTAAAINKAIQEAYGTCEKIITQGERILVRGYSKTYDMVIEMWVNVKDYVIETAYPIN